MNWIQYVLQGFKSVVPRKINQTYAIKFIWQLTPVAVFIAAYYSRLEFLPSNDPYLMQLYDLKATEVVHEKVEEAKEAKE
jgi:hypothetical protein